MHIFSKPLFIPQQVMRQLSKVNAFENPDGVHNREYNSSGHTNRNYIKRSVEVKAHPS
jgi:hypothetical protein